MKHLTPGMICAYADSEDSLTTPCGGVGSPACQDPAIRTNGVPPQPSQPPRVSTHPTMAEYWSLLDRTGRAVKRITETQAATLIERRLIETTGRRQITGFRLKPGVALAAVNAALRVGVRGHVPIAELSTVRKVRIEGGQYVTLHRKHLLSWGVEIEDGIAE